MANKNIPSNNNGSNNNSSNNNSSSRNSSRRNNNNNNKSILSFFKPAAAAVSQPIPGASNDLVTQDEFDCNLSDGELVDLADRLESQTGNLQDCLLDCEAKQSSVAPDISVQNIDVTDELAGPFTVKPIPEAVQDAARILKLDATGCLTFRQLLLSLVGEGKHKDKLVEFIDADVQRPDTSLVPITAFAENKERRNWDIHCPVINNKWVDFCRKTDKIAEGSVTIEEMAAPSGPQNAKACMVWHFPTFLSPNKKYSHVMDPGTQTLGIQKVRLSVIMSFLSACASMNNLTRRLAKNGSTRRRPNRGLVPGAS